MTNPIIQKKLAEFENLIEKLGWQVNSHGVFNASDGCSCSNPECKAAERYKKARAEQVAFFAEAITEAQRETVREIMEFLGLLAESKVLDDADKGWNLALQKSREFILSKHPNLDREDSNSKKP